ncbi:hypothetical protein [Lacinutrix mariniflava]|uniref:hypothetical protein n=1 Tax=Lacinutrix mariniflava TaxID=342955 RepID=UPI0006E3726C|nr:hypothetical protein [Lacinutrix mariniflava]
MSFGAVQSAITSMKNNRNLLSKRDRLKKTLSGSEIKKPEYNLPKSTPETIKRIKEKIIREDKLRKQKRILLIVIFSIILVSTFVYIML